MDSQALAYRMEGDGYKPSRAYRDLLSQDLFQPGPPAPLAQHREQVLKWCRWFAGEGYGRLGLPPGMGGDPFKFQCLGYELGLFDLNLMMRFGLQFGFVLRAVSRLGSDRQQKRWLEKIAAMEITTCLAMTEHGHGSNVKGLETLARYEPEHRRYVLTSPTPESSKAYVACGLSSELCLVFAQLEVGGSEHGVHAFLVPLRDDGGQPRSGVELTDAGLMGGLNGLDYATIRFTGVTVPAENLLDRHARVDSDGTYTCTLKSGSHRFNALMGTLVVGRGLVCAGASAGAKICLAVALRHGNSRRQFRGGNEELERVLLSFQAQQRELMPRLATLLAIDAGRGRLAQCQHEYSEDSLEDRKLETFAAALKAYTSTFAVGAAQACRESCGGAGCLSANRLTELRRDLDLFTTMEGDNTVLNLMVARNLLTDFRRGLDGPRLVKALGWVSKGFKLAAQSNILKSKGSSSEEINSTLFFDRALRFRVERLRYTLALRVRARIGDGMDVFEALTRCQDHCLALSTAHCEEKVYRCLRNVVESCPPGWDQRILSATLSLFALSAIERDKGWFLEQGYINPRQSQSVRDEVLELCSSLARESDSLVGAFELPPQLVRSPLYQVR